MLWENSLWNGPVIQPHLSYPIAIARTGLLVLLATALGGVWTLEQPEGSLLKFYPSWREVMNNVFRCGGEYAAPCPLKTIEPIKQIRKWNGVTSNSRYNFFKWCVCWVL